MHTEQNFIHNQLKFRSTRRLLNIRLHMLCSCCSRLGWRGCDCWYRRSDRRVRWRFSSLFQVRKAIEFSISILYTALIHLGKVWHWYCLPSTRTGHLAVLRNEACLRFLKTCKIWFTKIVRRRRKQEQILSL